MWTTTGEEVPAGDVFGDSQEGPTWELVYTNPNYPHEQLRATFGVVFSDTGRYSGSVMFVHEQLIGGDWEITDAFYSDHDEYGRALYDVAGKLRRWKRFCFSDTVWHAQESNHV